jgi:hypothetical protein
MTRFVYRDGDIMQRRPEVDPELASMNLREQDPAVVSANSREQDLALDSAT